MVSFEDRIFNQIYWKESLKRREELRTNQEIELAGIKRSQKVLDLRCGPGLKTKVIGKKVGNPGEVVCINENKFLIEHAKNFYNCSNIKFIQADISDSVELVKKYYGEDKRFDHVLFSWIYISPKDLLKLIKNINKLLKKGGIFTLSRGGDNLKHPFTKLFNECLQENLIEAVKEEHPRLGSKSLLKLKNNINVAKVDPVDSLRRKKELIENCGFKMKKTKEVIWPITLKKKLEFYKNPLRNRYVGKFPIKERYKLIRKAFRTTIKELGKKKLQGHKYFFAFEKII